MRLTLCSYLNTDCVRIQITLSFKVHRYSDDARNWSERIERCERLLKGWLNNGRGGVERGGRRGLGGGRVSKLARLPSGQRRAKNLSLRVALDYLLTRWHKPTERNGDLFQIIWTLGIPSVRLSVCERSSTSTCENMEYFWNRYIKFLIFLLRDEWAY